MAAEASTERSIGRAVPQIMRELDEIRARTGGCPTGGAVATAAGRLPATWVFHAVGPVYSGGERGEAERLASAYRACLALAEEKRSASVSFPAISAGIYGYPLEEAAAIATGEVIAHLRSDTAWPRRAIFVLFDERTLAAFLDAGRRSVQAGERFVNA